MPATQSGLKFDYARARIQNYLDDHEITREDFSDEILVKYPTFNNFMADDSRKLAITALAKSAQTMGITYEKLISPLGPEDYTL
ncbi:hypothetical protein [Lacticaseibacillus manihotivorans]|uniref:XRE family transcriptional regulator n=1 Tax=Lacticaseibacillus manihotivorans TaxID=88233 RepID=A0A5P8JPY2_9LACO|nr:hypothetical protein [Lacticaseibacillus manihotivorans]QFQ90992.1 hypothetical protein LM010_05940 [Lacticaseibacillus manihotivorans]